MSWTIDDTTWEYPCTIEREAEIKSSDISGMMLNKQYFNDVLGTWMKYKVAIAIPRGHEDDYEAIYIALTNPVGYHSFTLPYGQGTIDLVGRVQTVSDVYVRLAGGGQTWRKTTFEIIANHPREQVDIGQAIEAGTGVPPGSIDFSTGDMYEYTSNGWVQRSYEVLDGEYY